MLQPFGLILSGGELELQKEVSDAETEDAGLSIWSSTLMQVVDVGGPAAVATAAAEATDVEGVVDERGGM